jgi:MoaA/NifB/PqqE/SkfB family radical SAM enzyme
MSYKILYRGPLHCCNYACSYCPFAKSAMSPEELADDARKLQRFVDWALAQDDTLEILFTPWGEALGLPAYRHAIVQLSHAAHIEAVAIQTNLAYPVDWTADARPERFALWTTYHPEQVARERFLERCRELDNCGRTYSVGMVGIRPYLDEVRAMRKLLPHHVYLWVNAYKREPHYYTDAEIAQLTAIDPLFPYNLRPHPSRRRPCHAGDTAFTVDGDGHVRRCHFIEGVLGNLYDGSWRAGLSPRPCTNDSCRCHIGYVHMPELGLYDQFGDGLMARVHSMHAATLPA